ncbi:hypothetical protein WJX74_006684 [Apatococcus lobatus]|uniref:Uncharacterized protein n=1 Tax=Apatococcus lobatus TaxID=904363 RepID=A0AAW1RJI8_9CHLO
MDVCMRSSHHKEETFSIRKLMAAHRTRSAIYYCKLPGSTALVYQPCSTPPSSGAEHLERTFYAQFHILFVWTEMASSIITALADSLRSESAPLLNLVLGTRLPVILATAVRELLGEVIPGWEIMPPVVRLPLGDEGPVSLPKEWGFPSAVSVSVIDFPCKLQDWQSRKWVEQTAAIKRPELTEAFDGIRLYKEESATLPDLNAVMTAIQDSLQQLSHNAAQAVAIEAANKKYQPNWLAAAAVVQEERGLWLPTSRPEDLQQEQDEFASLTAGHRLNVPTAIWKAAPEGVTKEMLMQKFLQDSRARAAPLGEWQVWSKADIVKIKALITPAQTLALHCRATAQLLPGVKSTKRTHAMKHPAPRAQPSGVHRQPGHGAAEEEVPLPSQKRQRTAHANPASGASPSIHQPQLHSAQGRAYPLAWGGTGNRLRIARNQPDVTASKQTVHALAKPRAMMCPAVRPDARAASATPAQRQHAEREAHGVRDAFIPAPRPQAEGSTSAAAAAIHGHLGKERSMTPASRAGAAVSSPGATVEEARPAPGEPAAGQASQAVPQRGGVQECAAADGGSRSGASKLPLSSGTLDRQPSTGDLGMAAAEAATAAPAQCQTAPQEVKRRRFKPCSAAILAKRRKAKLAGSDRPSASVAGANVPRTGHAHPSSSKETPPVGQRKEAAVGSQPATQQQAGFGPHQTRVLAHAAGQAPAQAQQDSPVSLDAAGKHLMLAARPESEEGVRPRPAAAAVAFQGDPTAETGCHGSNLPESAEPAGALIANANGNAGPGFKGKRQQQATPSREDGLQSSAPQGADQSGLLQLQQQLQADRERLELEKLQVQAARSQLDKDTRQAAINAADMRAARLELVDKIDQQFAKLQSTLREIHKTALEHLGVMRPPEDASAATA